MALNNMYDARLRQETAVGAGAQVLLLALLGPATGMGPAGWLTGLAFACATWAALSRALHRSRLSSFGPANRVTLGRATLVGGVTALVADSFESAPPVTPLVALTAVALLLDGVDGEVARRTGSTTALGARFDMEVDAFLILVLSVYVSTRLGPWVLLIGGMRYAFVAAARFAPWLTAPLPASFARKTVAALQGVSLLLAGADLLPRPVNLTVVLLALGSLVWSFGRDVVWLRRTARTVAGEAVPESSPRPGRAADLNASPSRTPNRRAGTPRRQPATVSARSASPAQPSRGTPFGRLSAP
ncbi:CDP-alcohol phosphatidyltransferase family protein [Streptomyces sp. E-15]